MEMEFTTQLSSTSDATGSVLDRTLLETFQKLLTIIQNDELSAFRGNNIGRLDEFVENCDYCMERMHIEGLVSKNEELDDIQTSTMPLLFLSYFKGKALASYHDLSIRRVKLLQSRTCFQQYLDLCVDFKLLHETEMRKVDKEHMKPMSGDEKRVFKIEKFKRERTAKQRIMELRRFLEITKHDTDMDHEEEQRECYTLMLQSYARDAIDEMDMMEDEIIMLSMREEEQELMDSPGVGGKGGSTPNEYVLKALDPNRPGIQITRTFKAGDQLVMSRDTVKAQVFGTGISPPTMSLDEFGDQQLQDAVARQEAEANAPKGPRKYKELLADGEEDNDDLLEQATIEDRKWDAWKEENPRGWGNKMGKRF